MSTFEFTDRFNSLTNTLQAFAYKLTKDIEHAHDLFQETAYRALRNRDKFRADTNFRAWLFTIMKNIFINDYRKKAKMNTLIDTTDNLFFINSGKQKVSNGAASNILMEELTAMINQLDDSIKVPFMMHYKGYKYQEIADDFQLPLGTIKSRIFFARKELKRLIKINYGGRPIL